MWESKVFKKDENLNLKDITKRWMFGRILKGLLVGISGVLLISTMTLYWNPVVKIKSLFVQDTVQKSNVDSNYIQFLGYSYVFLHEDKKLNDTNFLQFCKYLNLSHPYETTAQHMYESANFNPTISSAKWNNTGGFMTSGGYMHFKHWTDCIYFTKKFQQQHGLKRGMNYYSWISSIHYHEADKMIYNSSVSSIEQKLRRKFK